MSSCVRAYAENSDNAALVAYYGNCGTLVSRYFALNKELFERFCTGFFAEADRVALFARSDGYITTNFLLFK